MVRRKRVRPLMGHHDLVDTGRPDECGECGGLAGCHMHHCSHDAGEQSHCPRCGSISGPGGPDDDMHMCRRMPKALTPEECEASGQPEEVA